MFVTSLLSHLSAQPHFEGRDDASVIMNNIGTDQTAKEAQSDLGFCCSHTAKAGFHERRLISHNVMSTLFVSVLVALNF